MWQLRRKAGARGGAVRRCEFSRRLRILQHVFSSSPPPSAMDTDSSIDALAALTTFEDYGDIRYVARPVRSRLALLTVNSVVTIPGCSTLSSEQRTAVHMRARCVSRHPDTRTLELTLGFIQRAARSNISNIETAVRQSTLYVFLACTKALIT